MKVLDKIDCFWGGVVAAMTAILGKYWFLFAGFLVLNFIDYGTGIIKARYFHRESSAIGAKGVFKKVFYWVVIAVAFFIAYCFTRMGNLLNINLSFVMLFGWFTLATYIINEIRSILENMVEMGVNIPTFLISGLDITQRLLDDKLKTESEAQNKTDIEGGANDEI